ncbi:hypothetical protein MU448_11550 [Streptococcus sp. O1]|uniref:hypothetical protein n=1 Tax=Streptococcus sp. O1 TaxID=2928735 RepID=UPI00211B5A61|nr:hypothetical protein [Streptococcus sp. O1]MCQ9214978.1 hypothetical protein [Streptococcus sp. O1]
MIQNKRISQPDDDVARSELSASSYSHQTSFDIPYDSDICRLSDLRIGTDSTIYHDKQRYPCILTGYSVIVKERLHFLQIRERPLYVESFVKRLKKCNYRLSV